MLPRLKGAFSTVVMTKDKVVAFRDPAGLRPLALGMLGDRYCVAERVLRVRHHRRAATCATSLPGEVVTLVARRASRTRQVVDGEREAFCVFEYIYFARPDSRMDGHVLQVARGRMGEILAREAPARRRPRHRRCPTPATPPRAASRAPRACRRTTASIKNRYVARTFIQPGQELRKHGLRMKFNPLPEVVGGKRLVVVDDSIVRGNTTRQIVQMLRDAGAAEVHMRISAPPIKHPCHYGIDMSTREEMIAHGRTAEEIAAELGADSLAYLSLEGVYEAVGGDARAHCDACFTRRVPAAGHRRRAGKTRSSCRCSPRAPKAGIVG